MHMIRAKACKSPIKNDKMPYKPKRKTYRAKIKQNKEST